MKADYFTLWSDCTAEAMERFHYMTEKGTNALQKIQPVTPGGPDILFPQLIAIARKITKDLTNKHRSSLT